jgi:hypothetical protein
MNGALAAEIAPKTPSAVQVAVTMAPPLWQTRIISSATG